MSDGPRPGLERLAEAFDIQASYLNLDGEQVHAPPDSLLAVLRAMGALENQHDVPQALLEKQRRDWCWALEPALVAWQGQGAAASMRLPEASASGPAYCRLALDGGEAREWTQELAHARMTGREVVDGVPHVELRLALPRVPLGYHSLSVEVGGRRLTATVIAAPRQAYQAPERRAWGVFLPLYALHSRRSWGIGDYTDLRELLKWAGRQGASFAGTLPLLPTFLERPFQPSPYQPLSRLLWSEAYIDPGVESEGLAIANTARALNQAPYVDYREVMRLKRQALSARAESLGAESQAALRAYVEEHPAVADYAAFRAAMERLGPDWRRWPQAARAGSLTQHDYDTEAARYYELAQWLADEQMHSVAETARQAGTRLYLDLPVGVHPAGYDAWRYQDVFAQGMSVGAPPDLLASNGQDWGFQPLLPEAVRRAGYEYPRRYLHHFLAFAGMLRIDHAIGLHRLYWIPEGGTGRDGVFVRQPSEELYAMLCLESRRHEAVLIGENLGLVPPEVDQGLREHGISGMYVQMFELTGDERRPQKPVPRNAVASFGTHDLPPFAAYWRDEDLGQRQRLGLLTPARVAEETSGRNDAREALLTSLRKRGLVSTSPDAAEVYRGSTALLAESNADWLVLNLEDAWGETRAQNLPGTQSDAHPNWTARAAYSLDEFESHHGLNEALETVRRYRPGKRGANPEGG